MGALRLFASKRRGASASSGRAYGGLHGYGLLGSAQPRNTPQLGPTFLAQCSSRLSTTCLEGLAASSQKPTREPPFALGLAHPTASEPPNRRLKRWRCAMEKPRPLGCKHYRRRLRNAARRELFSILGTDPPRRRCRILAPQLPRMAAQCCAVLRLHPLAPPGAATRLGVRLGVRGVRVLSSRGQVFWCRHCHNEAGCPRLIRAGRR